MVGTSEVSATVVGQSIAAAASAPAMMPMDPLAIQVSMSTVAWTEERAVGEDAVVMRVADAARSVANLPPQTVVWVPEAGRMEGDASVVSLGAVVTGQVPVPVTLALAGIGETAPAERPQSEGVVSLGTSVDPPRALMRLGTPWLEWVDPQNLGATSFVLNDPAEEREWVSYNGTLRGVTRLMHTALVSMNDGLAQLNSAGGSFKV